jgi:hypothetical protein
VSQNPRIGFGHSGLPSGSFFNKFGQSGASGTNFRFEELWLDKPLFLFEKAHEIGDPGAALKFGR